MHLQGAAQGYCCWSGGTGTGHLARGYCLGGTGTSHLARGYWEEGSSCWTMPSTAAASSRGEEESSRSIVTAAVSGMVLPYLSEVHQPDTRNTVYVVYCIIEAGGRYVTIVTMEVVRLCVISCPNCCVVLCVTSCWCTRSVDDGSPPPPAPQSDFL